MEKKTHTASSESISEHQLIFGVLCCPGSDGSLPDVAATTKPRQMLEQWWRCEIEVVPSLTADEADDDIGKRTFQYLQSLPLGPNQKGMRVEWLGCRVEPLFFGMECCVIICRICCEDESVHMNPIEALLEMVENETADEGCPLQSARLRSQRPMASNRDAFEICRDSLFPKEILLAGDGANYASPPRFGQELERRIYHGSTVLTADRIRHLFHHGYVVWDGFVDDDVIMQLVGIARSSLAERKRGAPTSITWIEPEPRNARSDVTTWLDEPNNPIAGLISEKFDQLGRDLRKFTNLAERSTPYESTTHREFQLARYQEASSGYKRHTDANPTTLVEGGIERKITAILYCNLDWKEEHGGVLRLTSTDFDGAAEVGIEPLAGRLLLFLSGCMVHEVMPSARERFAATAWYR